MSEKFVAFMCRVAERTYKDYMFSSDRYTKDETRGYFDCRGGEFVVEVVTALDYFDRNYAKKRRDLASFNKVIAQYEGYYSLLFQRLYKKYIDPSYILVDESEDPIFYIGYGDTIEASDLEPESVTDLMQYLVIDDKKAKTKKARAKKPVKVRNPNTNRCVNVGGSTYKKLVAQYGAKVVQNYEPC